MESSITRRPPVKQIHALLFRSDIRRDKRIVQDSVDKPFDHVKNQIVSLLAHTHTLITPFEGRRQRPALACPQFARQ